MMIVVKVGGSVLSNIEQIARDLKEREFVLVHGIGPQMDEMQRAMGVEPQWHYSPSGIKFRYTDAEAMRLFNMVASGMSNEVVVALQAQGIDSVGVVAALNARRKERIRIVENGRKRMLEGDYSGKIESCSAEVLQNLISSGIAPVVPPIAISENHELVNVNGDRAAAVIARDLEIDTIVNLSDIPGVLRGSRVIRRVGRDELEALRREVDGGMTMKLLAVQEAFDFGAKKVIIAPGNVENPVENALKGRGTVFE
ncbi:MAG: [LysW]-aminoadipate/[LysW]-glutamate kinase [archaeon]